MKKTQFVQQIPVLLQKFYKNSRNKTCLQDRRNRIVHWKWEVKTKNLTFLKAKERQESGQWQNINDRKITTKKGKTVSVPGEEAEVASELLHLLFRAAVKSLIDYGNPCFLTADTSLIQILLPLLSSLRVILLVITAKRGALSLCGLKNDFNSKS